LPGRAGPSKRSRAAKRKITYDVFQERRNVKRLNSRKVCDPGFGAPIPKPVGRSQVRAPCVIVTDLRGKEFQNPLRGFGRGRKERRLQLPFGYNLEVPSHV